MRYQDHFWKECWSNITKYNLNLYTFTYFYILQRSYTYLGLFMDVSCFATLRNCTMLKVVGKGCVTKTDSCIRLLEGDLIVVRANCIWWAYLWVFYCLWAILCLSVNCRRFICKFSLVWERLIDFFPPCGKTSLDIWTGFSCKLDWILLPYPNYQYFPNFQLSQIPSISGYNLPN